MNLRILKNCKGIKDLGIHRNVKGIKNLGIL